MPPPGKYPGGPSGPQPVVVQGPVRSSRGPGWYYVGFPPEIVEFFHISAQSDFPLGFAAGDAVEILPPGGAAFPTTQGLAYLISDLRFHAWRTDGAGAIVPLERNALTGRVHFRFTVDGVSISRMLLRSMVVAGAGIDRPNFPYLEERVGPHVGTYSMLIPIRDSQRISAFADVISVPFGFTLTQVGWEMSGLRMPINEYEHALRVADGV